jgi:DNA-binding transcriptional regulator GbsR (MarR family)
MVNEIGETAGKIWAALVEENKAMTVSQLRKKTKLTEDLLYMGIGWLTREDKLQFAGTSKNMEVSRK